MFRSSNIAVMRGTVYEEQKAGNIWTNIDRTTFQAMKLVPGDKIKIDMSHGNKVVLKQTLPYFPTFGRVPVGKPLLYLNSLNKVALAINQGNYLETYNVQSGASWSIRIEK